MILAIDSTVMRLMTCFVHTILLQDDMNDEVFFIGQNFYKIPVSGVFYSLQLKRAIIKSFHTLHLEFTKKTCSSPKLILW